MSARKTPLEYVGAVSISAPAGKSPYYRLHWKEVNGDRSGRSSQHSAAKKMARRKSPPV